MAQAIEIKYTLCKEDILKGMRKSGYYKTTGARMIVENILLGVFFIYFVCSYFFAGMAVFNLFMAAICLVLIVAILVVPNADMAIKSAKMADGKELTMRVTPYKILIRDYEKEWSIQLDGTSKCKVIDNRIIAIMTPERRLIILPTDQIPKDKTTEFQTMIFEGTTAY